MDELETLRYLRNRIAELAKELEALSSAQQLLLMRTCEWNQYFKNKDKDKK